MASLSIKVLKQFGIKLNSLFWPFDVMKLFSPTLSFKISYYFTLKKWLLLLPLISSNNKLEKIICWVFSSVVFFAQWRQ